MLHWRRWACSSKEPGNWRRRDGCASSGAGRWTVGRCGRPTQLASSRSLMALAGERCHAYLARMPQPTRRWQRGETALCRCREPHEQCEVITGTSRQALHPSLQRTDEPEPHDCTTAEHVDQRGAKGPRAPVRPLSAAPAGHSVTIRLAREVLEIAEAAGEKAGITTRAWVENVVRKASPVE